MKYLKNVAPFVLLLLISGATHAGGEKPSLFNCGLNLGGITKSQKAVTSATTNRHTYKKKSEASFDTRRFGVAAVADSLPNRTGRRRMPPVFTFARAGCTW